MSDSNHTITFKKVSSGTAGARALNSFIGSHVTCPDCGTSVPVTAADVSAYTAAHGVPAATDGFNAVVEHGTGPKVEHGTGP